MYTAVQCSVLKTTQSNIEILKRFLTYSRGYTDCTMLRVRVHRLYNVQGTQIVLGIGYIDCTMYREHRLYSVQDTHIVR